LTLLLETVRDSLPLALAEVAPLEWPRALGRLTSCWRELLFVQVEWPLRLHEASARPQTRRAHFERLSSCVVALFPAFLCRHLAGPQERFSASTWPQLAESSAKLGPTLRAGAPESHRRPIGFSSGVFGVCVGEQKSKRAKEEQKRSSRAAEAPCMRPTRSH